MHKHKYCIHTVVCMHAVELESNIHPSVPRMSLCIYCIMVCTVGLYQITEQKAVFVATPIISGCYNYRKLPDHMLQEVRDLNSAKRDTEDQWYTPSMNCIKASLQ